MTVAGNIASLTRKFGVDMRRVNVRTSPFLRLSRELQRRGVGVVLDVGANDGGFAIDLIKAGYHERIISFEPLPVAWEALKMRAARQTSAQWEVGPRIALSNAEGSAVFHEAGNSVSSSLLPMLTLHEQAAPGSAISRQIEVTTSRLDQVLDTLPISADQPLMLKIDVQGAERMVLAGAKDALKRQIVGVKLELSLAPLYEGQPLWLEMHHLLEGMGFHLWDIDPGFRDVHSGRLLQFDGIYFRDEGKLLATSSTGY